MLALEHGETLPAASVAVAQNVVDELLSTVTPTAKLPPVAVPLPARALEHEEFV